MNHASAEMPGPPAARAAAVPGHDSRQMEPVPAICAGTGYDAARPADAGVLILGVTGHRGVAGDGACHLPRGQPLR